MNLSTLFLLTLPLQYCQGFLPLHRLETSLSAKMTASNRDDSNEPSNEEDGNLFALPAMGSSSFWENDSEVNKRMAANLSGLSSGIKISDEVLSRKFQMQYTCKVCDTRNTIKVNRIAYRKGMVIAQCKGCESKHLIADNLNWLNEFDVDNGETNIDQYMTNRNEENGEGDVVVRVKKEVFDLEQVLYKNPYEDSALTPADNDNSQQWG